ncbi:hypothetical protein LAZ67_14002674 [Cordylochernes scorpioides]|uniref:Helix-turn-helix domain-containing protein n=1 Tax=Cordylochernes scorpioides TaxID=51811 RepID=A0ABY6L9N6_9ARAC|nr:hypothetical protein LAZ67_14002674 [Cordylochernes scorpioides]
MSPILGNKNESNGYLPFLDILFENKLNYLQTTVFRKPSHSPLYLHANSFGPISHKIFLVKTLTKRAFTHCSTDKLKYIELNTIQEELISNGYTKEFIKKHSYKINSFHSKTELKNKCIMPYGAGAERIAHILKNSGITTVFKNAPSLKTIVRNTITKQKVEIGNTKDVVYRIPCKSCNVSYIGETGRFLGTRLQEHKSSWKYAKERFAMVEHGLRSGHQPDWENTSTIYRGIQNSHQRKFLEAIASMKDPASVNRYENIPEPYLSLST